MPQGTCTPGQAPAENSEVSAAGIARTGPPLATDSLASPTVRYGTGKVRIAPEPAAQQFPSRRKLTLEAFVVWAVLSTVYLLTLAGNYSEAEDSLDYLVAIRSGDPSAIVPIHLAFGWFGWSAYQVA